MSITRWLEMRCDLCEEFAEGGLRPGVTAAEIRAEAKSKGWVKMRDGRDICADCVEARRLSR